MLLLGLAATPGGAAAPEDARRAYDAGRFTDAMGIWAELSRQGDAEAAFSIGLLYDVGNGTRQNAEAAFFWYSLAAEAGLPEAEFNVGAMYDGGRGVAQDSADAALWFARAAVRGHHRAQYDLGQLYEAGDGVPRNLDAAAVWFRDAADGGIAAAGHRLKALQAITAVRPGGSLTRAAPAYPTKNAKVTLHTDESAVELVWIAPAEPQPVHYEVWVGELAATLRTAATATVPETATLVRLPPTTNFYVWSVDVVGRDGAHARSDWSWFSVAPPEKTPQSLAAVPQRSLPNR